LRRRAKSILAGRDSHVNPAGIPSPGVERNLRMDASGLLEVLRHESTEGFKRIAGSRVEGTLPIPGTAIARALREGLPRGGPVTAVDIALQAGNRAVLLLAIDRFPFPRTVELPLAIERSADTPEDAIDLQLMPGGLLRIVLPLVSSALNRPGVTFHGNRVRIVPREMLDRADDRAIAGLLRSIRLRTAPGTATLDFALEVPDA